MAEDIRVRLSPEGLEEVLAAIRKVSKDAEAASKSAAGGINSIKDALSKFRGVLATLGVTASVAGIVAIGKASLDAADHVEKMAQITGSSAENFSILAFGAKTTKTSAEDLEKGLVRLSSTLGALSRGSAEQVDLFGELGLSAESFKDKDTVEAFAIIAKALEKQTDGFKKVDIQRRIFGRGATELQDLLQKVGVEGFDALTAKAVKFGAVISTDTANKAEELKRNLALMEVQSGKLSRSLLADMLPALNQIIEKFIRTKDELGFLAASFQALGNAIIAAFKGADKTPLQEAEKNVKGLEDQIAALQLRLENVSAGPYRKVRQGIQAELAKTYSLLAEAKSKLETLTGADKPGKPQPGGGSGGDDDKSVQDKITQAAKAGGVDRLNILTTIENQKRAEIEKTAQVERAQLEAKLASTAGLLSSQQALEAADLASIARRRAAAEDAFKADIEAASLKEQLTRKGAQQFMDSADFSKILTGIEKQASQDRAAAAQRLFTTKSNILIELFNKEKEAQTKLVALDQQTADFRKRATQAVTDITNSNLSAEVQAALKVRSAWENEALLRDAAITGNIEKVKQLREEQLAAGKAIGGPQGAQIIDEAQRLSDLATDSQKLALQGNVTDAQKGAADLAKQIVDIKAQLAELSSAARVDVKVELNKESLNAMVKSMQEQLAKEPFQINVQAVASGSAGASVPALASGGMVPGVAPHARADNVLARLTPGEFVMPVPVVRHFGTDFMENMRRFNLPGFADGGMVGGGSTSGAADRPADMVVDLRKGGRTMGRLTGSGDLVREFLTDLQESGRGGV